MNAPVTKILVGLRLVGLVGLRDAMRTAEEAGLVEREEVVDRLLGELSAGNHIPDRADADYRLALWREYVRYRGGDVRPLFSELPVEVTGPEGPERASFVETLRSILADHELRPAVAYVPPEDDGPSPSLRIAGETVVLGAVTRRALRQALRRRLSHW